MCYPLILSTILFIIGILGMSLSKKNILMFLISLELILLAASINFVGFSVYLDDFLGQIYSLMILTVGAAESALGLAILIVYYRLRGGIKIDMINLLKG
jgi:NADH-quinone oxidoreductase subunit K